MTSAGGPHHQQMDLSIDDIVSQAIGGWTQPSVPAGGISQLSEEVRKRIDTTIEYVQTHGGLACVEQLKRRNSSNPKYNFLFHGEGSEYWSQRLQSLSLLPPSASSSGGAGGEVGRGGGAAGVVVQQPRTQQRIPGGGGVLGTPGAAQHQGLHTSSKAGGMMLGQGGLGLQGQHQQPMYQQQLAGAGAPPYVSAAQHVLDGGHHLHAQHAQHAAGATPSASNSTEKPLPKIAGVPTQHEELTPVQKLALKYPEPVFEKDIPPAMKQQWENIFKSLQNIPSAEHIKQGRNWLEKALNMGVQYVVYFVYAQLLDGERKFSQTVNILYVIHDVLQCEAFSKQNASTWRYIPAIKPFLPWMLRASHKLAKDEGERQKVLKLLTLWVERKCLQETESQEFRILVETQEVLPDKEEPAAAGNAFGGGSQSWMNQSWWSSWGSWDGSGMWATPSASSGQPQQQVAGGPAAANMPPGAQNLTPLPAWGGPQQQASGAGTGGMMMGNLMMGTPAPNQMNLVNPNNPLNVFPVAGGGAGGPAAPPGATRSSPSSEGATTGSIITRNTPESIPVGLMATMVKQVQSRNRSVHTAFYPYKPLDPAWTPQAFPNLQQMPQRIRDRLESFLRADDKERMKEKLRRGAGRGGGNKRGRRKSTDSRPHGVQGSSDPGDRMSDDERSEDGREYDDSSDGESGSSSSDSSEEDSPIRPQKRSKPSIFARSAPGVGVVQADSQMEAA